jgi:putative heme-binding domain-containing protein
MHFRIAVIFLAALRFAGAQHAGASGNPVAGAADVGAGRGQFQARCAVCHGPEAMGGPAGPNLVTGVLKHGGTDEALYRVITQGIPGSIMTGATMNGWEVWQIIAYLRDLQNAREVKNVGGDAARGAHVFRSAGCARCHAIGGEGGHSGPDLAGIGLRRTPAQLMASLIDPGSEVGADYWSIRARTRGGETVTGLRLNEDTRSVQALEPSGRLRSLLKSELASLEILRTSPMPSFKELPASELADLVTYLANLGRQ